MEQSLNDVLRKSELYSDFRNKRTNGSPPVKRGWSFDLARARGLEGLVLTGWLFMAYSGVHNIVYSWRFSGNFFLFLSTAAGILSCEWVFSKCFHGWIRGKYKDGQQRSIKISTVLTSAFIGFGLLAGQIAEASGGAAIAAGSIARFYYVYTVPFLALINTYLSMYVLGTDRARTADIKLSIAREMHAKRREMNKVSRAVAALENEQRYYMAKIASERRKVRWGVRMARLNLLSLTRGSRRIQTGIETGANSRLLKIAEKDLQGSGAAVGERNAPLLEGSVRVGGRPKRRRKK